MTPQQTQQITRILKEPNGSDLERWAHALVGRKERNQAVNAEQLKQARAVIALAQKLKKKK